MVLKIICIILLTIVVCCFSGPSTDASRNDSTFIYFGRCPSHIYFLSFVYLQKDKQVKLLDKIHETLKTLKIRHYPIHPKNSKIQKVFVPENYTIAALGTRVMFHSVLVFMSLPGSTLSICTASVICLSIASSRNVPVILILNRCISPL